MKVDVEIMEILGAYDLTKSLRGAAELPLKGNFASSMRRSDAEFKQQSTFCFRIRNRPKRFNSWLTLCTLAQV